MGYFWYVDDILIIYSQNKSNINSVLTKFNNINPKLSFSLELELNNKIYFLDITISRHIDSLLFSIYRKIYHYCHDHLC
jgi:hypothetical protein